MKTLIFTYYYICVKVNKILIVKNLGYHHVNIYVMFDLEDRIYEEIETKKLRQQLII